LLVLLEGVDALGGEGDTVFGCRSLGVQEGEGAGAGALEGAVNAGRTAVEIEVFPAQAEEFALAEPGAQGELVQRVEPVTAGAWRNCRASAAVRGRKRLGRGAVVLTFRATLRGSSSSRTACSKAALRTE
jgi:hypothetical protein